MLTRIALSNYLFLFLLACRPEFKSQNPFVFYPKKSDFFSGFVNTRKIPDQVNRDEVARLVNYSYPIELALFNDGNFYYYLENLGDGMGVWNFENGQLKLYAERKLFAMNIGVHSIEESGNEIAVDFTDRFGTQFLQMDFVGLAK